MLRISEPETHVTAPGSMTPPFEPYQVPRSQTPSYSVLTCQERRARPL
jgi:hypothetical protein